MIPLQQIKNFLLVAEAKALATNGSEGLNVVPVSTIKIENDHILLVDYFFSKTRKNLQQPQTVALTAWSDLKGYQVKATVEYLTEGKIFNNTVTWVAKQHPERIVYGVVRLSPTVIYDIGIG